MRLTRRNFLKFGAAGMVGAAAAANYPFLGRRLALAGASSNFFTIAVIPDSQDYVDPNHPQPLNESFFLAQTTYLAQNRKKLNLAFVSHVGDMVEHGDGSTEKFKPQNTEWTNGQKAMNIWNAAGVPFCITIGNHDYDNMYYPSTANGPPPLVSTGAWWKNYFGSGSHYFNGKLWYGGASDHVGYISTGKGGSETGMWPPKGTRCNYGLSSYQFFSAAGKKFLHISLEMESGDPVIAWAQGVLDAHPGYPVILSTHSYISPPDWGDDNLPLVVPAKRNEAVFMSYSPSGWNDAQSVWDKFIAPNDQIFLVLCGHAFTDAENTVSRGENIRIDNNKAGNPVYQVLTDYQGNTTLGSGGGDGWYRFMQFDMDTKNIHFYTLNAYESLSSGQPVLAGQKVIYPDGMSDFEQPQGFSDFSLAMPVRVLNAPRQVETTSTSFDYSRYSGLHTGTVTLTNTSHNPITDPVAVALESLTSGVTLVNAAGLHNGAPYVAIDNDGLAPGASLTIPVQFSNPSRVSIKFTPEVFELS